MFPFEGFGDTIGSYSGINHSSGLIASVANQYAAMPSLHAMDAIIVGLTMAAVCPGPVGKGDLAALAAVGLVQRDVDRQPLLARHRGRGRSRVVAGARLYLLVRRWRLRSRLRTA